jgi:hypothetical protein
MPNTVHVVPHSSISFSVLDGSIIDKSFRGVFYFLLDVLLGRWAQRCVVRVESDEGCFFTYIILLPLRRADIGRASDYEEVRRVISR